MQQPAKIQSKIIKEETVFEGKWIGLKYVTFSVGDRVIPNYQTVYRTTRKSNVQFDGIQIVPIIQFKDKPSQLILIANFRPPIGKFALEFPSGLVQSEDYEENARRQLLEETGYVVNKFLEIPYPIMYSDPWKSNECGLLYIALIDGDDPKCLQKQALQQTENIRVHRVTLDKDLPKTIHELAQKNDYGIEDKVWSLCIGTLVANYAK